MDNLALERVRLARARWQEAEDRLFAVLPPHSAPIGGQQVQGEKIPTLAQVQPLLKDAQGAYSDYLTELHRLNGG